MNRISNFEFRISQCGGIPASKFQILNSAPEVLHGD